VEQVACHRVEGTERLVHEHDVGALRQGTGQLHALSHAARELVGELALEPLEVDDMQQLAHALAPLRLRDALELERELDVALGGEPREQRRLLEHERGAPVDLEGSGGGPVEAGDEVQQRALAAPRRAQQAHELAGADVQRHAVERGDRVTGVAVDLAGVAQDDGRAGAGFGRGDLRSRLVDARTFDCS
jgi:hypothetical protein